MVDGNNVDILLKTPYHWEEISDNFCDVLICGQVFEHIEFPWLIFSEIARVVKPNGIICIIVPSMSGLHRYPVNCQNYFSDGMIALAKYEGFKIMHASTNLAPVNAPVSWYGSSEDTFLVSIKPENWKANSFIKEKYICNPANLEDAATGFISMEKQNWYKNYQKTKKLKILMKLIFNPIINILKLLKIIKPNTKSNNK